jgi:hypothetical protein
MLISVPAHLPLKGHSRNSNRSEIAHQRVAREDVIGWHAVRATDWRVFLKAGDVEPAHLYWRIDKRVVVGCSEQRWILRLFQMS